MKLEWNCCFYDSHYYYYIDKRSLLDKGDSHKKPFIDQEKHAMLIMQMQISLMANFSCFYWIPLNDLLLYHVG